MNNINVHLTVIVSLRVPPLLAYDLSNLDVILLFNSVSAFLVTISATLTELQLHSFYTILGGIVKLGNSQEVTTL